jgi:hypothetical protein
MSKEKIICAAIKLETGEIFYGHRHNNCIEAINSQLSWDLSRSQIKKIEKEQGFVTSDGRFVDRQQAWKIAESAGQIIRQSGGKGTLYSEDIY